MILPNSNDCYPMRFSGFASTVRLIPVSSECPRCGSSLSTFALAGATAVACDGCGYAGVEADHTGEPRPVESWADAFARFQEDHD